jgi:hypothetical protein
MSIAKPERTFFLLKTLKIYLKFLSGETRINGLVALMLNCREINIDLEKERLNWCA